MKDPNNDERRSGKSGASSSRASSSGKGKSAAPSRASMARQEFEFEELLAARFVRVRSGGYVLRSAFEDLGLPVPESPWPSDLTWLPKCPIRVVEIDSHSSPDDKANTYANALAEANLTCCVPFIFRRNGELVYVSHDEKSGEVHIAPITNQVLASMLAAVGMYTYIDSKGRERTGYKVATEVVTQVAVRLPSDSRIPELRMLVCSPVLLRDGRWADEDMYADGMLIRLRRDVGYRPVPADPDEQLIAGSVAAVLDVTSEIKFPHAAGLGGLLGRAVGLVAKPYIGKVPISLVTGGAKAQGSGKSTAVTIVDSLAVHGTERAVIPAADKQDNENEKRIDEGLMGTARAVVMGNFPPSGVVESSGLSEVNTSPPEVPIDLRRFGAKSGKPKIVYNVQCWNINGNNMSMVKDIRTRGWRTEVDAHAFDPSEIQWRVRDLDARLARDHEQLNFALRVLVQAALVRLQDAAYRADVEKRMAGIIRGDYFRWTVLCCAVADLLGVEFGTDQAEFREQFEEQESIEAPLVDAVVQCLEAFGQSAPQALLAAVAAYAAEHADDRGHDVLKAMCEAVLDEWPSIDRSGSTSLGGWLRKHRGDWGRDSTGGYRQVVQKGREWTLTAPRSGGE